MRIGFGLAEVCALRMLLFCSFLQYANANKMQALTVYMHRFGYDGAMYIDKTTRWAGLGEEIWTHVRLHRRSVVHVIKRCVRITVTLLP